MVAKKQVKKKAKKSKKVSKKKPKIEPIVEEVQPWGAYDENGIRQYYPHYKQGQSIMSKKRFVGACAGTGGGKTTSGGLWFLQQLQDYVDAGNINDFVGFIVAPTNKILRRATMPCFLDIFDTSQFAGKYTPSRNIYKLPGDLGVIYALSADNPESLVGSQAHAIWLDEGGQCSQAVWDELQQRTGVHEGRILITSTPYRANWFKTEIVDRAAQGDPDYSCFIWSSIENPAYPKAEYERAKRTLPSQLFEMRYNARFTMSEGRVYYGFSPEETVRPCSYYNHKTIIVSSDFNVNPMAWILAHRDGDVLEVFDELNIGNTTTAWTLDLLWAKYQNHKGNFQFFGDASSKNRHTSTTITDFMAIANDPRFSGLGRSIHYLEKNPSVLDRYAAVNGKLKSADGKRTLYIDPSCTKLIKDLESCFYKEKTRQLDTRGNCGHATDALGYCVHRIWPIQTKNEALGRVSWRKHK